MDESVQEFLEDAQKNSSDEYLNRELPGAPKAEATPEPEKDEDHEPRNRAERRARASRWEEQLSQKERDIIEREARLKALEEFQKKNVPDEVPDEWLQMWGDKPETRAAWALQQKLNERTAERIREEVRQEMLELQRSQVNEKEEVENGRVEALELIEDNHSIDLTSNSPAARKAREIYLKALEDVADDEGNADPEIAYELYTARRSREQDNSRNKELADRSVAPSAPVNREKAEDDATRAWLRSQGLKV